MTMTPNRERALVKSDRLPPLETVFEVDFRGLAGRTDEIPDEIEDILRLFDGRRTLRRVIDDSGFPALEVLRVLCKLQEEKLVCERALPLVEEPAPALRAWLDEGKEEEDAPAKAAPPTRWLVLAGIGLAAAAGLALVVRPRAAAPIAVVAAPAAPPVVAAPVVAAPVVVAPVAAPVVAPVIAPVEKPAEPEGPDYESLLKDGKARYEKGQLKAAVALLEQAIERKPDGDEALTVLAHCQLDRGAAGKALASATRATQANPQNADAYLVIGAAQQQNGRNGDARSAYERYLSLAPRGSYAGEIRSILRSLH